MIPGIFRHALPQLTFKKKAVPDRNSLFNFDLINFSPLTPQGRGEKLCII